MWYTFYAMGRSTRTLSRSLEGSSGFPGIRGGSDVTHYGIPRNPGLRTTSWLRMRWLMFWGYKVLEVRRRPRQGWFSRLCYDTSYLLLPKKNKTEES